MVKGAPTSATVRKKPPKRYALDAIGANSLKYQPIKPRTTSIMMAIFVKVFIILPHEI